MVFLRRQKDNFQRWVEGSLPTRDYLGFDWKEKVKLPCAPSETSDHWHMQQKYGIAVYGAGVYRHGRGSTAANPCIVNDYYINLTDIREQTAEAANNMLASVLRDAKVPETGVLRLRIAARTMLIRCQPRILCLRALRCQTIYVNFWGEQHGKSILDGAFGGMSIWLDQISLQKQILNLSDLLNAYRQASSASMQMTLAVPHLRAVPLTLSNDWKRLSCTAEILLGTDMGNISFAWHRLYLAYL